MGSRKRQVPPVFETQTDQRETDRPPSTLEMVNLYPTRTCLGYGHRIKPWQGAEKTPFNYTPTKSTEELIQITSLPFLGEGDVEDMVPFGLHCRRRGT